MLDTVNKISQSASKKQNFANFKNDPSLYIENLILQQNKFLNVTPYLIPANEELRPQKDEKL